MSSVTKQTLSSTGFSTETSELDTTLSDHTETSTEFVLESTTATDFITPIPLDGRPYFIFNCIFFVFVFFIALFLVIIFFSCRSSKNNVRVNSNFFSTYNV